MSFPAQYDGWCERCQKKIHQGDDLEWPNPEDGARAVHVTVEPDDPTTLQAGERVCGVCYLVHRGECL